jgi:hypothetical protein
MRLRVLFEPRDLWVGLFWTWRTYASSRRLELYVCVIPMLPLLIIFPERARR